eukprot:symbB.v1.2.014419.t1/scaffold1000.1/size145704/10
MGETKPGLATYLGWLGKFDPEALTILSTPTPPIAWAMRLQADAIWGKAEEESTGEVASTPSDMLEAILFGAWLHDADANAEECLSWMQMKMKEQCDKVTWNYICVAISHAATIDFVQDALTVMHE